MDRCGGVGKIWVGVVVFENIRVGVVLLKKTD